MSSNVVPFVIVFVIAILFFAWSSFRRFRLIALGKVETRTNAFFKRLGNMLYYAFGQRRVVSRPFGINHFVLFWSFMALLIANTEFLLNGLFPNVISLDRLPDGIHFTLAFIFDIVSLLALLAVISAIIRRVAFRPSYIDALSRDAFAILAMVATLMIAFFGMNASEIAASDAAVRYMPISSFLASSFMSGAAPESLAALAGVFWWIHAVVLLAFLNYLPYSKHMHVLTSIPNCFFKSLEKVTTQSREEFRKENEFGVGQVDGFIWKGLFDSYSCTECGRCTDVCPAANTGKPLNPKQVIHDIKINLLKNGPGLIHSAAPELPLIGNNGEGSITEEVLWECTTCGACMEVCPVFIEHVPRIVDMRRHLVEMKAQFPQELLTFFESMEQRSNPWGIAPSDRTKWAADLDVKPFEKDKTEYLFYVGCAGAFDARNRKVTLSIARILDAAGISWGILGKDELCCGDSLRRLGNEYAFDRMARENVTMFAEKGVQKVITLCPHCYNTLKNDYRQYGAELEVVHHSELISELISAGKLKLKPNEDSGNIVFHDSCYLGRYNQIYEAPRQAVAVANNGKSPLEMERHLDRSFCCGAGGGRMWMEETIGKRIYVERTEEALKKDPATICVCCPYCMTMFEDGVKDKNAEAKVKVLDVAEIVARSLE